MMYFSLAILLFLGLILVFFFKSTLLKLVLVVFWYPLVPMYLFCLGVPVGGSLEVIGRQYHQSHCDTAFILALGGYYLFIWILWSIRKYEIVIKRLKLNEEVRLILVFLVGVISIIAYPRAFGMGGARWGLIPGPWPVFFIVFNVLLLLSHKSIRSGSSIFQLIIVLLSILGGERANSVLLLGVLFIIESTTNKEYLKERRFKKSWLVGGFLLFIMATAAGYTRGGMELNIMLILHNVFAQHTATDVIHVYFSSFDYIEHHRINLLPLINEVMSLIPLSPLGGAGHEFNFTEILRANIYNYGGGLFYTEGVLFMGKAGVLIYSFIYGVFIKWVFTSRTQLGAILILLMVTQQLRIQWYGLVYAYSPILFTVLIVGLFNMLKYKPIQCYIPKYTKE